MKDLVCTIKENQLRVYGIGGGLELDTEKKTWVHYSVLCDIKRPIGVYMTSNFDDHVRKENARKIKGAKLVYSWTRGNYIDDPYGNPYKVGEIVCEIWDFREVVGCSKSIEECVDFEIAEMLKAKGILN